jgi:hypothetical protein
VGCDRLHTLSVAVAYLSDRVRNSARGGGRAYSNHWRRRRNILNSLLVCRARAITFLGFAYLAYASASYREHWNIPVCVFRLVTGLSCPLCGLTRSIGATLAGQVATALRFHILGPAVVIANCCAAVLLLLKRHESRAKPEPSARSQCVSTSAILADLKADRAEEQKSHSAEDTPEGFPVVAGLGMEKRRCDLESTYLSVNSIIACDSTSGSPGTHVL